MNSTLLLYLLKAGLLLPCQPLRRLYFRLVSLPAAESYLRATKKKDKTMSDLLPHTGVGRESFDYQGFRIIVHPTTVCNHKLEHRACFCGVITGRNRRRRVFADTPQETRTKAIAWVDSVVYPPAPLDVIEYEGYTITLSQVTRANSGLVERISYLATIRWGDKKCRKVFADDTGSATSKARHYIDLHLECGA